MNYQIQPSHELLENWKVWMALEILRSLEGKPESDRVAESIDLPVVNFAEQLKPLEKLLTEKASKLKNTALESSLEREKVELEEYCRDIIIGYEMQNLSISIINDSITLFNCQLQDAAKNHLPREMSVQMKGVLNRLVKQRQNALKEAREHEQEEKNAWGVYTTLKAKKDPEAAWNAIVEAFKSNLKAEYSQAVVVQLYRDAESICRTYLNNSENSLRLLSNMKTYLVEEQSFFKVVDLPIFSRIDCLKIDEQRRLLEIYVQQPVTNWGSSIVAWQEILKRLLINLEQPATEIFNEFCSEFIKVVKIKETVPQINAS